MGSSHGRVVLRSVEWLWVVRLRCVLSQESKEEGGRGKGAGGMVGRWAGEEQRKSYCSSGKELPSCTDELKPLMACALTQAELLRLDCPSQFIPVSQACK